MRNDRGQGRDFMCASVRAMSAIEAAWVGAMIDGEGSVICPDRGFNELRLTLGSTEPEILSALLRATGVGHVTGKRQKQPHHLPFFVWDVSRWNDVLGIAEQCAPFSLKAQRALALGGRSAS